eukprot:5516507-Pleurochrysis_carterae.AAC.1
MRAQLALKHARQLSQPQQPAMTEVVSACVAQPTKVVEFTGTGLEGRLMSARLVLSVVDGTWHVHQ